MKETNMPKADFLTSVFLIAFGLFTFIVSVQMPRFESQKANPYSVPGLVPGLLGFIIVLLGLILLIRSIRRQGHRLGLTAETGRGLLKAVETRRILLTVVISAVYAVGLVGRIPYWLATALYVFFFIVVFEYERGKPLASQRKRLLIALVVAVLTSASVTVTFQYLFLVNLPG